MSGKLTKAQTRMLTRVCGSKWGSIQQWEALCEGPRVTLDVLLRKGLVTEHFGALGSHPMVRPTDAGRSTSARAADRGAWLERPGLSRCSPHSSKPLSLRRRVECA